jgi:hypothetical protein
MLLAYSRLRLHALVAGYILLITITILNYSITYALNHFAIF